MLKRVFIVIILLIMLFLYFTGVQSFGLSSDTIYYLPTFNLAILSGINYKDEELSNTFLNFKKTEPNIREENTLNNRVHNQYPWVKTWPYQREFPWLQPYPKFDWPFFPIKDLPPLCLNKLADKNTPNQESTKTEIPSEPTCSKICDTIVDSPYENEELPVTDITPLVDRLPAIDTMGPEYINFSKDMDEIINKAAKTSSLNTTYGVFIMDLKTEFYYGINEKLTRIDESDNVPEGWFNSASVIKLFQGYIFCDLLRKGELDEDKIYYDSVTKRKFMILTMLKSMISYSDNNYSNACLRIVDNKKCNEVLYSLGVKDSRLYGEMSGAIGYSRENNIKTYGTDKRCARITPSDTGLILYNIYINRDTDKYMQALNEGLLGNIYNTRIPVGVKRVSSNYKTAHKTGTNSAIGVYNDAGIVYAENPFILVAFTEGTTSNKGHSFIRSLAEQLTIYFKDN